MSTRLANNGRLIDRRKPINFLFNSKKMIGYEGDSLAASLLANDQILVGRSFKYHRPRGIVASGAEEPNALINLGEGGSFEPNARATTTKTFDESIFFCPHKPIFFKIICFSNLLKFSGVIFILSSN